MMRVWTHGSLSEAIRGHPSTYSSYILLQGGWELVQRGKLQWIKVHSGAKSQFSPIRRSLRVAGVKHSSRDFLIGFSHPSGEQRYTMEESFILSSSPVSLHHITLTDEESCGEGFQLKDTIAERTWELHEYFPSPEYQDLGITQFLGRGEDVRGTNDDSCLSLWLAIWGTPGGTKGSGMTSLSHAPLMQQPVLLIEYREGVTFQVSPADLKAETGAGPIRVVKADWRKQNGLGRLVSWRRSCLSNPA